MKWGSSRFAMDISTGKILERERSFQGTYAIFLGGNALKHHPFKRGYKTTRPKRFLSQGHSSHHCCRTQQPPKLRIMHQSHSVEALFHFSTNRREIECLIITSKGNEDHQSTWIKFDLFSPSDVIGHNTTCNLLGWVRYTVILQSQISYRQARFKWMKFPFFRVSDFSKYPVFRNV